MGSSTATPSQPTKTNLFNSSNSNGINDQEHFYAGTYPKFPVAEQNQTYMAYFDGVGGTGPEYLGGTGYFIKYLIDEEGNISKPTDTLDLSSPGQVPLYNLYDNFENEKNAIVKLVEYDPTISNSATGKALTGKHKIIGIGELYPVCVTEYGPNPNDFIQYLKFGPSTVPTTQSILDLNAAWLIGDNTSVTSDYFNDWQDVALPESYLTYPGDPTLYYNFPSQSVNWTSNSPYFNKILNISTEDANTQIAAKLSLDIINNTNNPDYQVQFRLLKNKPTLGTSSVIFTSDVFSLNPNPIYPYPFEDPSFNFGSFDNVYIADTPFFDLDENDVLTFQVKFYYPLNFSPGEIYTDGDISFIEDHTCSFLRIYQQYPVANNGTVQYIGKENQWGWGYFNITNPPAASGSFSNFFLSWDALWIYFSGQIQQYTNNPNDPNMNYNQFVVPFGDIKPGDLIRLGYDKDNVYTITGVFPRYYGLNFMISPQVPASVVKNSSGAANSPSQANNFSITKLVKNGRYMILDVEKPKDGIFFSGIVQPEYSSEALQKNYDKIIQDLTLKEIIN